MRKLGIDEWLIKAVESMYSNARSCVCVNRQFSSWFDVKVGVHQGSVLSQSVWGKTRSLHGLYRHYFCC